MADITARIGEDTASPNLRRLMALFNKGSAGLRINILQDLAAVCVRLTQQHVLHNGTIKQNWPTTGFYKAVAAEGVDWELIDDGAFKVMIDHPTKSGAMKQRYYGGRIDAKDHLLTIPARAEFYGHAATEFTNLRFGIFKTTGTKFLYIGQGGVGKVDFETGREQMRVKGAGPRQAMMVAYWLKESVFQEGDPGVIPAEEDYISAVMDRLAHRVNKALHA